MSYARAEFEGDGVVLSFAAGFKAPTDSDVVVLLDDVVQTLTTHYSLSRARGTHLITVLMVTEPASGETLTIKRATSVTDAVTFEDGQQSVQSEYNFDEAIDELRQAVQELKDNQDRSVFTYSSVDITTADVAVAATPIQVCSDITVAESGDYLVEAQFTMGSDAASVNYATLVEVAVGPLGTAADPSQTVVFSCFSSTIAAEASRTTPINLRIPVTVLADDDIISVWVTTDHATASQEMQGGSADVGRRVYVSKLGKL